MYIVLDDVGFSAMSCYGGPIETPNIDRIAADGIRYTQWHTTALCSPTRSCLLTGRNHTRNSMACITEAAVGFPNASGTIPPENGMISEILGERGWNTYIVGKWHLCPTVEMNVASTRRNWPSGRGFERFYGFLGAETNQWYPDLVYDNHPVDQPKSPAEGYHLTEDLTDKALEFIKDAKTVAPDKPFFLYYAPGAAHAPHQVPKEWADKFKGRFDMGYEAIREQTLARQKEMGIVPADTELPPVNPIGTPETRTGPDGQPFPPLDVTRPWDSLSARGEAAVRPDGRGVRRVPGARRPPHRPAAGLPGGVRAAGQHHGHRGVGQRRQRRGRPERVGQRDASSPTASPMTCRRTWRCSTSWAGPGPTTTTPTAGRWRSTRRSRCGSGMSSTAAPPTRASSPGPRPPAATRPGRAAAPVPPRHRHRADHPGHPRRRRRPATIKGHVQSRFDGVSMRYSAEMASAPSARKTQFYSMLGSRGIWHDGWKAVTTHPTLSGWSHFNDDTWELYHTDTDRAELHDLAAEHPDKLRELVNLWFAEAGDERRVPAR